MFDCNSSSSSVRNKGVTELLKCKLPPLVLFLARHVSFLSRQFSFLSIRVSFLTRVTEPFSMEYITREKSVYNILYQRFLFAVHCQISEADMIGRKFVLVDLKCHFALNLQHLVMSVLNLYLLRTFLRK